MLAVSFKISFKFSKIVQKVMYQFGQTGARIEACAAAIFVSERPLSCVATTLFLGQFKQYNVLLFETQLVVK